MTVPSPAYVYLDDPLSPFQEHLEHSPFQTHLCALIIMYMNAKTLPGVKN